MFIAHLPAGYIAAHLLSSRSPAFAQATRVRALLLGSVFPDLDMLYFYFVDRGRHLHHHYWTHLPLFWLAVIAFTYIVAQLVGRRGAASVAVWFGAGVLTHLLLDTPFGGILWLAPFSDQALVLVAVPATRSWWVWSFVLHWSFLVEIAICIVALIMYFRRRRFMPR